MNISNKEKEWILKNSSKRELESVREFLGRKKKTKVDNKKNEVESFYFKKKKTRRKNFENREGLIMHFMEGLLNKITKAEMEAYEILDALNIEYIKQHPLVTDQNFFFADIFIPSIGLVVELDGLYHKDKRVKNRDKWRSDIIRKMGYKVVRYDNDNVFNRASFISSLSARMKIDIPAYTYTYLI